MGCVGMNGGVCYESSDSMYHCGERWEGCGVCWKASRWPRVVAAVQEEPLLLIVLLL